MPECISVKKDIWQHEKKKAAEKQKSKVKYFFDIEKCKRCPYKEVCYKDGAKSKSYTETIISDTHSEHALFQETEYFKEKSKKRYKIEAKNRHGYHIASSQVIIGMEIQGTTTIFVVNMKRIIKLLSERYNEKYINTTSKVKSENFIIEVVIY